MCVPVAVGVSPPCAPSIYLFSNIGCIKFTVHSSVMTGRYVGRIEKSTFASKDTFLSRNVFLNGHEPPPRRGHCHGHRYKNIHHGTVRHIHICDVLIFSFQISVACTFNYRVLISYKQVLFNLFFYLVVFRLFQAYLHKCI